MENLKVSELKDGYYQFGNKGAVWSNQTHIAKSGQSGTLCGTPMLSSNWARIENHTEIGCAKCLKLYNQMNIFFVFKKPTLWFCENNEISLNELYSYFTKKTINELLKNEYLELDMKRYFSPTERLLIQVAKHMRNLDMFSSFSLAENKNGKSE
jgi:hypothetical protein